VASRRTVQASLGDEPPVSYPECPMFGRIRNRHHRALVARMRFAYAWNDTYSPVDLGPHRSISPLGLQSRLGLLSVRRSRPPSSDRRHIGTFRADLAQRFACLSPFAALARVRFGYSGLPAVTGAKVWRGFGRSALTTFGNLLGRSFSCRMRECILNHRGV